MGCKKITIHERFYKTDENASYQAKWLADVLNQCGLTCSGLAKKIHVTRQSVSNWLLDKNRMTYNSVVVICYRLSLAENSDEVYTNMRNDWKRRKHA